MGVLFNTLFGYLFSALAKYFTVKMIVVAAAVASFILIYGTLTLLFNTSLSALQESVPSELDFALGLIPSNLPTCLAALFSARIAVASASLKMRLIELKARQ